MIYCGVNMRKAFNICISIFTAICLTLSPYASSDGEVSVNTDVNFPSVSATSACIIECDSGDVIYEKNSNKTMPMASTTKIMTAIVAIENAPMKKIITVSSEAVGIEGSSIYLCENERLTTEELLYALMLESANDAACALAIEIGGSVEGFVDMMNDKASSLGLRNTHFTNPHGLGDTEHYSTAQDLATLMAYCMKNETFAKITSTKKFSLDGSDDSYSRLLVNHNRLLGTYEGITGGKTGYTKNAGRCLVTSCERNGVTLCAVTLNAPDDWNDHKSMYSYGFTLYKRVVLETAGQFEYTAPVCGGDKEIITAHTRENASAVMRINGCDLRRVVYMRRFYYPEIEDGDIIGYVNYFNGDLPIASSAIYADYSIGEAVDDRGFFEKLKDLIN